MLKNWHSIVTFEQGRALPDRLTRRSHEPYLRYGEKLLALYHGGVGKTREELHCGVEEIFEAEAHCDPRRVRSFMKLLDDASEYGTDPEGRAARLRLYLFSWAAKDRRLDREKIAKRLERPWNEIEAAVYADYFPFHRLGAFRGYPDADALLSRYNVAQVQACVYHAEALSIDVTDDFKAVLRHAKLARLLHEIKRLGPSHYRIRLTGPSAVLKATRRYGVKMARFIPALLACRGWTLEALIRTPWKREASLLLTANDGLKSYLPGPEPFDSHLEQEFAERFGAEQQGWRLKREGEILHDGQTTFVPDFVFRKEGCAQVLFEIVGFWTPEYLQKKRETLNRFKRHKILIALPERLMGKRAAVPGEVIIYKNAVRVEAVLDALNGKP